MQKSLYKKNNLYGLFKDFKHHAKSYTNSKRMRARRERIRMKRNTEEEQNE